MSLGCQDCISLRLRATDIRIPSPSPSETMAVLPFISYGGKIGRAHV